MITLQPPHELCGVLRSSRHVDEKVSRYAWESSIRSPVESDYPDQRLFTYRKRQYEVQSKDLEMLMPAGVSLLTCSGDHQPYLLSGPIWELVGRVVVESRRTSSILLSYSSRLGFTILLNNISNYSKSKWPRSALTKAVERISLTPRKIAITTRGRRSFMKGRKV